MKQQSIALILFLLLGIFIFSGCAENSFTDSRKVTPKHLESMADSEHHPDLASDDSHAQSVDGITSSTSETVENVTGVFKGLEGNHTAVFSFNGVETAFHFEEPSVQKVLFEAIVDSNYTLSYYFDPSTGLYVIYEITES